MLEVFTFVNDDHQYAEMVRAFKQVGFGPFVQLSDQDDDPYTAINRIGRDAYAVLCHQDVRPNNCRAAELFRRLEELDRIDPSWTVAGNAGVTRDFKVVRRLVDAFGGSTPNDWPIKVVSLDENFLVLNGARCSPELSGFHMYGTDVCMYGPAYVIDFPLEHLGDKRFPSGDYRQVRDRFVERWQRHHTFRYLGTPIETLFLSRFWLVRKVFGSQVALNRVARRRKLWSP